MVQRRSHVFFLDRSHSSDQLNRLVENNFRMQTILITTETIKEFDNCNFSGTQKFGNHSSYKKIWWQQLPSVECQHILLKFSQSQKWLKNVIVVIFLKHKHFLAKVLSIIADTRKFGSIDFLGIQTTLSKIFTVPEMIKEFDYNNFSQIQTLLNKNSANYSNY